MSAPDDLTPTEWAIIEGAKEALERTLNELVVKHLQGHHAELLGSGFRFDFSKSVPTYWLTVRAHESRSVTISGSLSVQASQHLSSPIIKEHK